jgi:hypothetical protein
MRSLGARGSTGGPQGCRPRRRREPELCREAVGSQEWGQFWQKSAAIPRPGGSPLPAGRRPTGADRRYRRYSERQRNGFTSSFSPNWRNILQPAVTRRPCLSGKAIMPETCRTPNADQGDVKIAVSQSARFPWITCRRTEPKPGRDIWAAKSLAQIDGTRVQAVPESRAVETPERRTLAVAATLAVPPGPVTDRRLPGMVCAKTWPDQNPLDYRQDQGDRLIAGTRTYRPGATNEWRDSSQHMARFVLFLGQLCRRASATAR